MKYLKAVSRRKELLCIRGNRILVRGKKKKKLGLIENRINLANSDLKDCIILHKNSQVLVVSGKLWGNYN